jgi:hypothetical protein
VEELLLTVIECDVRHIEVHMAKPLIPGPSCFETEIAIAKFEEYKSTSSDQSPAEMIQAGTETLWSEIHKLISSAWSKEELPDQCKERITVQF